MALLQVTGILTGRPPRLGYAEVPPGDTGLIVYVETMLPAKRTVAMPKSSAFNDLNFAIYLGRTQSSSQLIEATLPTPVRGLRSVAKVPFGDTAMTLVGAPTTQLAGGLSAALPWIVLGVGVFVSLLSASTVEYVARRRQLAEDLAKENERLYVEQRNIAGTLQHALLPEVPNLNASRWRPATSRGWPGSMWGATGTTSSGHRVHRRPGGKERRTPRRKPRAAALSRRGRGRAHRRRARPPDVPTDPRGRRRRRGHSGAALAELNRVPATISASYRDNGALLITMGGDYDIGGIGTLGPDLDTLLSKDARSVIVEMSKVDFMDTSGVALLLRIANRFGPIEIRSASPIVSRSIEALGLAGRLRMRRD
jgi:anti-anti-sigma factor